MVVSESLYDTVCMYRTVVQSKYNRIVFKRNFFEYFFGLFFYLICLEFG